MLDDRAASAPARSVRYTVREKVLTFVDRRRSVRRRTGVVEPRRLVTVVRVPRPPLARSDDARGPFPLVVFLHGFALMPADYRGLLRSWTRAGYVVAAPVLPGENADAPGGPDRADLLNQPGDLRLLIDRLVAASRPGGQLDGDVDPSRIAVAGHSDGGNTALAVAYDPRFRSRRIDAAVILAGADLPGVTPFRFPEAGPPLLAVQGTADRINPPADTARFFRRATRPKALLMLRDAGHYGPYMRQQPQLRIVTRVSRAFLDRALKGLALGDVEFAALGTRGRIARLRVRR